MAAFFSGLANQAQSLVADKLGKGEAPAEGAPEAEVQLDENGQPIPPVENAGAFGFMGGIMAKANAVKEAAAGAAQQAGAGNLQGMTGMVGGVMGNVQGLIPGMKREEEVPDPAVPAEGEYAEGQYAEYTEEQYAEQGYTEEEQYAQ